MFERAKDRRAILRNEFSVECLSDPMAVRGLIAEMMGKLSRFALPQSACSTIELVVAEALNNVVEHAYADIAGPIRVDCAYQETHLLVTVIDQGLGMPDGAIPKSQKPGRFDDVMDVPEGGYGWFLIQTQSEDIVYKRAGWENRLSFRIPLEAEE